MTMSLETKTRLIENRNRNRENPPEFSFNQKVFVTDKSAQRSKYKPRRKKQIVDQDIGNKIVTKDKKIIHKAQIQ